MSGEPMDRRHSAAKRRAALLVGSGVLARLLWAGAAAGLLWVAAAWALGWPS